MTSSKAMAAQRTDAVVKQKQYRDKQQNSEIIGSLLFMLDYMKLVP
jgi:hypothetical protein